jgi:ABC-type transport system involved in multi-copper enzyme maturation permease subunit
MSRASTGALVRSELLKIRSTRLWWGLLLGAVAYTAIQAGVSAGFAGVEAGVGRPATPGLDAAEAIRGVYAVSAFTGTYMFALILGITGMTGEYRYQTVTATFLVSPRRHRVVTAKMLAHLVAGIGYGLVGVLVALVAGGVVMAVRGHDLGLGVDRLWPSVGLAVLAVALWTLVGIGIGTLVRNQVLAIMLGVFLTLLLEPLVSLALSALDLDRVGAFLPSNASSALMQPANTLVDYLDWWAGGLVMLGYALVLAGLGMLLSVRRDVS